MSINKIIVVLTFVCLSMYRYASGDKFTLDEFLGKWYHVSTIYPPEATLYFTCVRSETKKDGNDKEKFLEVYKTMMSGKWIETMGQGKVANSVVHFSYPSLDIGDFEYTVTKYNDGKEIILHNKSGPIYSTLLSRTTTASSEAKAALEKKAAAAGISVTNINQDDC